MTAALTVIGIVVAVPFLIGLLLAVGLGLWLTLRVAGDWTRGLLARGPEAQF
jgi:hypothetical protein